MRFFKPVLTACIISIAGISQAQSEAPPPPIDEQAVEILENAAQYLAGQDAFSVKWFVSYDEVLDGREKLTQIRSGYSLLDRDNGFYGYLERGLAMREYFYDGSSFTVRDINNNAYAQVGFSGTFEALVARARDEYNVELPIWSVLTRQHRQEILGDAERAAYLGLTRIGGELAHHIALSNYDEDWQVWIADDVEDPRLLMIVGTDPYTQGWPQYRAYFTGWDFDPEIAEGAFTYVPDEDSERMSWPKVPGN